MAQVLFNNLALCVGERNIVLKEKTKYYTQDAHTLLSLSVVRKKYGPGRH